MPQLEACSLCEQPLDHANAQTILTTDGCLVHLACAERDATLAWQARKQRAVLSALISVGAMAGIAVFTHVSASFFVLLLVLPLHIWLNNRWWHYHAQRIRRLLIHWYKLQ